MASDSVTPIRKKIGPASAYAIAKAHGYTGTEAEWAAEIANASINAQSAAQSAAAAQEVLDSIPADYSVLSGDVDDLKSHHNLQIDSIPGTEQTILFDDEGNVRSITHSANGTAVRTDMFTFGDDTIIEVRTLASGEIMTIMTNTDTLVTTVAYTPAE